MIIVVQGTSTFNDYNVFLRAMAVAMSGMSQDDSEVYIYSAGPAKINSMVSEFCNISERGMKSRGMKIKNYKVSPSWVNENMDYVNYFAFLSQPNQPVSQLVVYAELCGVETGIFNY
jgi:hypothetical protein